MRDRTSFTAQMYTVFLFIYFLRIINWSRNIFGWFSGRTSSCISFNLLQTSQIIHKWSHVMSRWSSWIHTIQFRHRKITRTIYYSFYCMNYYVYIKKIIHFFITLSKKNFSILCLVSFFAICRPVSIHEFHDHEILPFNRMLNIYKLV